MPYIFEDENMDSPLFEGQKPSRIMDPFVYYGDAPDARPGRGPYQALYPDLPYHVRYPEPTPPEEGPHLRLVPGPED